MPRDINEIYQLNTTYFEFKLNNFQIWATLKEDTFNMIAQFLFSQGITFNTKFDYSKMPQNLKKYFKTVELFYKYVSENPSSKIFINHKGMVTIKKSEDNLILPSDVEFNMQKVHFNSQVNLEIQLTKSRQYINTMQITLKKQNESLNRVKSLNRRLIKQNKIFRQKLNKTPRISRSKRSVDLTKYKNKLITEQGQQVRQIIQVADQKLLGGLFQFAQKHKLSFLRQTIRNQQILQMTELNLNLQNLPNIPPFPFLHNLKILSMENNQISKMRNLSQLQNIQQIYLANNHLTKIQGLKGLKYLLVLDFSYNRIQVLQNLQDQVQLIKLIIPRNQLKYIENIFHLNQLQELDLSDNIIMSIPSQIQKLNSLRKLNLDRNLCYQLNAHLTRLEKLKELRISCKVQRLGKKFDPQNQTNAITIMMLQSNQVDLYLNIKLIEDPQNQQQKDKITKDKQDDDSQHQSQKSKDFSNQKDKLKSTDKNTIFPQSIIINEINQNQTKESILPIESKKTKGILIPEQRKKPQNEIIQLQQEQQQQIVQKYNQEKRIQNKQLNKEPKQAQLIQLEYNQQKQIFVNNDQKKVNIQSSSQQQQESDDSYNSFVYYKRQQSSQNIYSQVNQMKNIINQTQNQEQEQQIQNQKQQKNNNKNKKDQKQIQNIKYLYSTFQIQQEKNYSKNTDLKYRNKPIIINQKNNINNHFKRYNENSNKNIQIIEQKQDNKPIILAQEQEIIIFQDLNKNNQQNNKERRYLDLNQKQDKTSQCVQISQISLDQSYQNKNTIDLNQTQNKNKSIVIQDKNKNCFLID